MQMILHAEIDDQPRPDRDRGDEKDQRPPIRRVSDRQSEAAREIEKRERAEHDERKDPEKIACDPRHRVGADEPAVVVESMRRGEIEIGPDREHGADDESPATSASRIRGIGVKPLCRPVRSADPRCCGRTRAPPAHRDGVEAAKERSIASHGFLEHRRADRVDPQSPGQFDRRRARKRTRSRR